MGEFTLAKPRLAEVIKANGLTDERETMVQSKVLIVAQRRMLMPGDCMVSLKGESIFLIATPRRGFFIEKLSITQKEINESWQITKDEVAKIFYVKVLGGRKLHIQLKDLSEVIIDVTKKLEPAYEQITKALGYEG